jgi:hypothetical protein
MFRLKDSSQRESVTLGFVTVAFTVITGKFILSGLDLSSYGLGKVTYVSLTEYAASFAAVLMVWLGREWIKK